MRNAGYGVAVLGVILVILGVINHYVLKPPMNFVPHTSTILGAVGAVVAIVGLVLTFMAGRSSAS
jgi:protein-S-isoprenylcysteine O-methyltransferase Ste14